MDLTIDRTPFLEAFGLVAGVAPARSPKPIIRDALLVAGPDGCRIEATDLEVAVRRDLDGVEVRRPGRVVLPKERVGQILATSADATLDLRVDADRTLRLIGDRAEFKLQTEDPDLFPAFPDAMEGPSAVVSAEDLRTLVRRTVFACDLQSTRYALGGCLVEFVDDTVAMVATDGRRMAKMVATADGVRSPASGVVPARALKLAERSFHGEEPVRVSLDANSARFRGERTLIYSRLVEGRFPRYEEAVPEGPGVAARLEVGTFRRAIGQAAIATSDDSRGIDFAFGPGTLSMAGSSADVGSSRVDMAIAYDGPALTVAFDPRYLLDSLKVLDDALPLAAHLIGPKTAVVIRLEDGYQYVVSPLVVNR